LSGRVHRWHKQDAEHGIVTEQQIRRRNAPSGESCSVDLNFGELTATWKERTTPTPATWLCGDPDRWSLRPDNLNGFLRGTHILPQSSSLRLLHLPAEERWKQILRVASGFSEIDDLSAALQGARSPLTTELKARASNVSEAQKTLDDWRARVAAVVSKRVRAVAVAALVAPTQVRSTLAEEDVPAMPDTEAGARDLAEWLTGRVGSLRSERGRLEARRSGLTALADVPARWEAAGAAVAEALATVSTREVEELRLGEALSNRIAEEGTKASRIAAVSADEVARRRRVDELVLLAESLTALPGAHAALAAAHESASAAETSVTQAIELRDRAHAIAEHRRAYDGRLEAHHRRVAAREAAVGAWTRIRELWPRREALVVAAASLKTAVADTLKALEAARGSLSERAAETARARQLADSVRAAAGEVQGLVAALARHIHDDSETCPLCLARYPELGSLRAQVEKAKHEQGPAIAHAEDALADAAGRESVAAAAVERAGEANARAERALASNQTELGALDHEFAELRGRMTEIGQGQEDGDLEALRQAIEAERAELAVLPGATSEPISVLSVQLDQAEEAVRTAERLRVVARAAAEQAATALAGLNARVVNLRDTVQLMDDEEVETRLTAARAEAAAAAEAMRLATEAHSAAQTTRELARAAMTTATAATVSARVARDQRLAEQEELSRLWAGHELDSPPSGDQLASAARELAARLTALDAQIAALVDAVQGLGRWLDHAALDAEAKALDITAGGAGPDAWEARTQRLSGEVEAAQAARTRAATVQQHILRMAESAEARRASMRTELEARLRPILSPMLRSLIVDRRIADAAIALGEERRRTKMWATVGAEETDLLALASEGQLSGVNLAVQLSMALAFRWSRWPAVLLDDPAQYSDVVHSTNLVETLRVLALHHGFQVFLATHERDFALYVERKFRNDGLSATRVMFREPLEPAKGVVPRIAAR
jgi:hypothetical protein